MVLAVILSLLCILQSELYQVKAVQYRTLQTPLGKVTGRLVPFGTNTTVYTFLKIPFAKPPVGELRFRKPVPVKKWNTILDSTEFGPSCLQNIPTYLKAFLRSPEVSEDCLHLNVYTSGDFSSTTNKSVMVYFHGGGFIEGQAEPYDGSGLAVNGDVIVVTVNYRLGVLGFLSTGDSVVTGNYGLWDQIEALKWVQNNIRSFGGNPNSVTIFGQSSGAASVSLLSIIPENRGLFQRVILQSGVFSAPFAIAKKSKDFAIIFSNLSKCGDIRTSQAMIDCLRNIPADRIISTQQKAILSYTFSQLRENLFYLPIGPVIDGELIKSNFVESAQNTSSDVFTFFKSLDLMAGCVSAEGTVLNLYLYPYIEIKYGFDMRKGVPNSVLRSLFARSITEQLYNNQSNVWKAIVDKFGSSDIEVQARKIMDLYGDVFFYLPMIHTVDLHSINSKDGKTFQYMFSESPPLPNFVKNLPSWSYGAEHGSDIFFLFVIKTLKSFGIPVSPSAMDFVKQIQIYWTNFAKYGDPNRGRNVDIRWPEYDSVNRRYIDLAASSISQHTHMFQDRVKFWEEDLPLIASSNVTSNLTDSAVSIATTKWTIIIMLFLIFLL